MTKNRIAATVLGLALVLGGASTASAQTLADLQAQVAALMAQIASLQGGSVATSANFTQNLTIGSTGSEVVALQQMLVAKGYLVMPAGTAYGYFGGLTKAAVVKWQLAAGVSPASGYFGPISRAAANAAGGITTGGTTVGGTTTGGTTTGGSTGVITTPGVEGTLTASLNSTPTSVKLHEDDSRVSVMGIKLEAKQSDIKVERIQLNLGTNSQIYRDIADKVYIMDGSTVVGSMDLNTNTVVKNDTTGVYSITISGMNVIVPKDGTKVLTVALDAFSNIDSALSDGDSWTITVPDQGVRGIDGAGLNEYAPDGTSFSRSFTTEGDLADDATLKISVGTNTPVTSEVVASNGTDNNELDMVSLLNFDVKAEKDSVKITDLRATITNSAGTDATTTTVYLMDGSTVIGSDSVGANGVVLFDNIDYTVSQDSTRTLTIKADIRDADTTATNISASVDASGLTTENSNGDDTVTVTGSATGNTITVRSDGPQFSLVSKTINKSATASQNNTSTSTVSADFTVNVTAVGSDIYFGTQSASSTFNFQTYVGGTATTLLVASSTSFDTPSSGVVNLNGTNGQAFKIPEGTTVPVTAHFIFEGRTTAGALVSTNTYSVGLESIKWSATGHDTQTSNFMSGKTDWRTSSVTLP